MKGVSLSLSLSLPLLLFFSFQCCDGTRMASWARWRGEKEEQTSGRGRRERTRRGFVFFSIARWSFWSSFDPSTSTSSFFSSLSFSFFHAPPRDDSLPPQPATKLNFSSSTGKHPGRRRRPAPAREDRPPRRGRTGGQDCGPRGRRAAPRRERVGLAQRAHLAAGQEEIAAEDGGPGRRAGRGGLGRLCPF